MRIDLIIFVVFFGDAVGGKGIWFFEREGDGGGWRGRRCVKCEVSKTMEKRPEKRKREKRKIKGKEKQNGNRSASRSF